MHLKAINAPPLDETNDQTFRVKAVPGTDLWLKPPSWVSTNAPYYVAEMPVAKFHRARVTVKADWARQYDQGGLVLFLPAWPSYSLWVKSGIEFVDGKPYVSTVGARDAADWSILPVPGGESSITFEIEREEADEKNGSSLWVYLIEGGERKAVREMTWVFKEKADLDGMISVGVYAARPAKVGENDEGSLEVTFDDLTIV
jgi:uncharacterized protein